MLSIESKDAAALTVIDEVIRLSGRLSSARKMTSAVAGMNPAHWLVLTAICRAAAPPTVSRIARSFGQSRQAVQRIADALIASGMIEGQDNPADRRAQVMVPTPRGRDAFALADSEGAEWAAALVAGIDPADLATAAAVLGTLRRRLEKRARGAEA